MINMYIAKSCVRTGAELALIVPLLVLMACTAEPSSSPPERPIEHAMSVVPGASTRPAGVGEWAPFEIRGDIVQVNNSICAQSGSQMAPETLGKFTSRVVYDGPDERFRGKTLVFNQCCHGCVLKFPAKWAAERDRIMRFHGLVVTGTAMDGD